MAVLKDGTVVTSYTDETVKLLVDSGNDKVKSILNALVADLDDCQLVII